MSSSINFSLISFVHMNQLRLTNYFLYLGTSLHFSFWNQNWFTLSYIGYSQIFILVTPLILSIVLRGSDYILWLTLIYILCLLNMLRLVLIHNLRNSWLLIIIRHSHNFVFIPTLILRIVLRGSDCCGWLTLTHILSLMLLGSLVLVNYLRSSWLLLNVSNLGGSRLVLNLSSWWRLLVNNLRISDIRIFNRRVDNWICSLSCCLWDLLVTGNPVVILQGYILILIHRL